MDRRDGMALQGSYPYYLNKGLGGSGGSGPGPNVHDANSTTVHTSGMHSSVFKPHSNPNITVQQNVGVNGGGAVSGSEFHVENPSPNFPCGTSMAMVLSGSQSGQMVKKKRGRPRKYGTDGANMSLGLFPIYATRPHGEITPGEKRN